MARFLPWIFGLVILSLVGFLAADMIGAERYNGVATVIRHDYNEAYSETNYETGVTTFHDEEFILVFQYEDQVSQSEVSAYKWRNTNNGDRVDIVYSYGNISGAFYASIVEGH